MHDPDSLTHTVDLTRNWLRELCTELYTQDGRDAWAAFREVGHLLRDHLPDAEVAQLAAQLPLVLRGVWYEGWRPSAGKRTHDADAFLDALRIRLDRTRPMEPRLALQGVVTLLRRHISRGELEDVLHVLPGAIKPLFAPMTPVS